MNSYISPGSTNYTATEKKDRKKSITEKIKQIYREQPGEHIFKPKTPYERFPVIKLGSVFGMPLLRLLQKINIRFSPIYLTLTGLLCNIIAGLSFATGHLVQGALLFFTALVFDLVDGSWARHISKHLSLIKKLDPVCDRIGRVSCFAGLCYYQPQIFPLIVYYYALEALAIFKFPNRFRNPHNWWSFSSWEASFLILFIGPMLNMVRIFSALGITLLALSYIIKLRGK